MEMKEINYDKSQARIKKSCIEAYNELELPKAFTSTPLTVREKLTLKKSIRHAQNILERV